MMDPLEHLQMLKDSAAGIAPRKGDLKRIRALRFTEPGFDRITWREMCEMGWLGLRIPEDDGGSGLGAREFCGLAEELGAGLVPEPLILTDEEALTTFCANSIVIGRTVVMPAGAPSRVVAQLDDWGFEVVEVEVDEFHKGGGSIRCLTNPIDLTLGRDVPVVPGGQVLVPQV